MSITSFAQNLEDVVLWRALGDISSGTYIDIGAQDAVSDSVSLNFYEAGWRGVSVEATPSYVEALRSARPRETVIHAAVTDAAGPLSFYQIEGTGLSTGIKEIADRHARAGWTVAEITVPSISLERIFGMVVGEIHWLKIDVEGMEANVLRSWGDHPARPWVLVVEATAPNSQDLTDDQWRAEVTMRGYSETLFDGLSRYFLHEDHNNLRARLCTGPNVFDDYRVTMRHFSAQELAEEFHEKLSEGDRVKKELEGALAQADEERAILDNSLSGALERIAAQDIRLRGVEAERKDTVESLARIHAELNEATESVAGLQCARAEAEKALEDARAELDRRARLLAETTDAHAKTERALAQVTKQLAARDTMVAEVKEARDRAEQRLAETKEELAERTRSLDEANVMRTQAEGLLAQAQTSLDQQTLLTADAVRESAKFAAATRSAQHELAAMQRSAQDAIARPLGGWYRIGETLGLARPDPVRQLLRKWCLNRTDLDHEIWKAMMQPVRMGAEPDPYHRANSLADLLSWHDVDFVRCAYVTVLGRQPDREGEAYYTHLVRSGRSRMEILWRMRKSREGRMHDPGIAGFDRTLKRERWSRHRVVGLFRAVFGGTEADGNVNRQVRALANDVGIIVKCQQSIVRLLSTASGSSSVGQSCEAAREIEQPEVLEPADAELPPHAVAEGNAVSPRAAAITNYLEWKKQAVE